MIDNPPEWLEDWGRQVGAKLEDGLRAPPSFIAFSRENGSVCHTYTVMAPDPFVAPYHSFLLKRTPRAEPDEARAGARTSTRTDRGTGASAGAEVTVGTDEDEESDRLSRLARLSSLIAVV
jgi:hypothetical protein